MTPAINLARKLRISHAVHEYEHDPNSESYGLEAADKLQVPPERVFKTLVVETDSGELVVGVVPVAEMLSMKLIAKAVGAKKAAMADKRVVERSSGYVLGGVSPLGQKKHLKSVIDVSAKNFPTVYVSAGRRGLEIELAPEDLRNAINASFGDICQ